MKLLALLVAMGGMLGAADLVVGEKAPEVTLQGTSGGLITGGSWASSSLCGRLHVVFYVDPDEKELNEHVGEAIQRESFPGERFGSVAVINMDASAIPNFILNRIVAAKQKKFPRTVYVKDFGKTLVSGWGLADNSYDVVLFDEAGRVLFVNHGKVSDADVQRLVGLIRAGVNRLAAVPR